MRRRSLRRSRIRGRRGDWICTNGSQEIILLDPGVSNTIGEFELITPDEVGEHTDKILLQRVVGYFHASGPLSTAAGSLEGAMSFTWGLRCATQNSVGQVLPLDPADIGDMDAQWLFLRQHIMGQFEHIGGGIGTEFTAPFNYAPIVGAGGRHAPQGGPAIDINVKRKLTGRDSLLLSVGIQPAFDGLVWAPYLPDSKVLVQLHIRCFVTALG